MASLDWSRVDTSGGLDACWPWAGRLNRDGYGVVGKPDRRTHRLAYIDAYGPIPEDKPFVLHTCDNPPCCNPLHLWAGTQADNMADMLAKGRHVPGRSGRGPRGSRNGFARLTEEQVVTIRAAHGPGVSYRSLAPHFGVDPETIRRVVLRRIWTHV